MTDRDECIRKCEETREFLRKRGIRPGFVFDTNKVFSRIGRTGYMICHPAGEPDMQSSWAMKPEDFVKRYIDKE